MSAEAVSSVWRSLPIADCACSRLCRCANSSATSAFVATSTLGVIVFVAWLFQVIVVLIWYWNVLCCWLVRWQPRA